MTDLPKGRPILCIDFDGVIHSYLSGWKGATEIPDPPVDGALRWLRDLVLSEKFQVTIYSSRSRYENAISYMKKWLLDNGLDLHTVCSIEFPTEKPPAFLQIDDRAICFTGEFPTIEDMLAFKPWYKK